MAPFFQAYIREGILIGCTFMECESPRRSNPFVCSTPYSRFHQLPMDLIHRFDTSPGSRDKCKHSTYEDGPKQDGCMFAHLGRGREIEALCAALLPQGAFQKAPDHARSPCKTEKKQPTAVETQSPVGREWQGGLYGWGLK